MAFIREKQNVTAQDILTAITSGEDIELMECVISGAVDINRILEKKENFDLEDLNLSRKEERTIVTLNQSISIKQCIFEDSVFFASPWSANDEIDVVFKRDVMFNSSVFKSQTRFSGATFRGLAGFDGVKFESVVSFTDVKFNARTMFRTCSFAGYGLFSGSVFKKETRFTNTYFDKGGNFSNVEFNGQTDFSGVYPGSKSVPIIEGIKFANKRYGDDETFWRFTKQSAQEAGYYKMAGECFYRERCANLNKRFYGGNFENATSIDKVMRFPRAIKLLPEYIFGKILFGYGERPLRVLISGAFIIILCTLFYMFEGQLNYKGELVKGSEFINSLYFSTTTFTTLGFGDFYPADQFTRFVAMIEALAGASLTALFVVCLAKRFSRG